MNYIHLGPQVFFDVLEKFSIEYLSQYCQSPATKKFIYKGYIDGVNFPHLIFPKIVKANIVDTKDIVKQFPDLEEVNEITCYNSDILDIGNLKSVGIIYIPLYSLDYDECLPFIKKYVKVIDNNTLIINNEKLKVTNKWKIGDITVNNYKQFGF